jgi:hypothetical protein
MVMIVQRQELRNTYRWCIWLRYLATRSWATTSNIDKPWLSRTWLEGTCFLGWYFRDLSRCGEGSSRDVEELHKEYGVITTYAKRSHQLPVVSLLPSIGVLEVPNVFASISRILGVVPAAAYVMQSVGAPAPYGTRAAKTHLLRSLSVAQ